MPSTTTTDTETMRRLYSENDHAICIPHALDNPTPQAAEIHTPAGHTFTAGDTITLDRIPECDYYIQAIQDPLDTSACFVSLYFNYNTESDEAFATNLSIHWTKFATLADTDALRHAHD